MKSGFIHVCFVIDESGSMSCSASDVLGGFKRVVEEQKANTEGSCAISIYRFANKVQRDFLMKDISEVNSELIYLPGGLTAMNDGIGKAIDEVGEKLASMPEDERPEKNLIVIMTDGYENASLDYSIDKVRDMIKEQTDKYNWSFIYMGTDVTDASYANSIGVKGSFGDRGAVGDNFLCINAAASSYRSSSAEYSMKNAEFAKLLNDAADASTSAYAAKKGIKIEQTIKVN